jgi:hypothetical protein
MPGLFSPRSKLLDYLLEIRQDLRAGRLGLHLGEPNVDRFWGLLLGYHACQRDHGVEDAEYDQFLDWLREKGEYPTEGWAAKYLRDCQGDAEQAIGKYLDFVAEFTASRRV